VTAAVAAAARGAAARRVTMPIVYPRKTSYFKNRTA
jgi:hypothetical protein